MSPERRGRQQGEKPESDSLGSYRHIPHPTIPYGPGFLHMEKNKTIPYSFTHTINIRPIIMAQYTPEYIRAFQNTVTKTKSFTSVVTKQSALTTQDQKAAGRSKGCSQALSQSVIATQRSTGQTKGVQKATVNSDTPIVRGVLMMMIRGAIMEMPIITTQQSKGVVLQSGSAPTLNFLFTLPFQSRDLCHMIYHLTSHLTFVT